MKILVVGATGKTGELAWRKAVAEGHDVTSFWTFCCEAIQGRSGAQNAG